MSKKEAGGSAAVERNIVGISIIESEIHKMGAVRTS